MICFISKSQRNLCVPFSRTGPRMRTYHFFVWWDLNFWDNFQRIILLTESWLVVRNFICLSLEMSIQLFFLPIFLVIIVLLTLVLFMLSLDYIFRLPLGFFMNYSRLHTDELILSSTPATPLPSYLFYFFTHITCLYNLWNVRPYASSWVFYLSWPFIKFLSRSLTGVITRFQDSLQYPGRS